MNNRLTHTDFILMMQRADIRPSAQRLAVLEYVGNRKTHPTVDEIYSELRRDYPTLSRTTVYNSVNAMVKGGVLRELQIEAGNKRYDLVPQPPHSHFICRCCGSIFDVAAPSALGVSTPEGFNVDSVDVYLHGLCPACQANRNNPK